MLLQSYSVTWALFTFWFILFWIFGGVVFSLIAAARVMKTRKALFSCLFTGGSLLAAYGAAVMGIFLSRPDGIRCPQELISSTGTYIGLEALTMTDALLCDASSIFIAGGLCFVLLLAVGILALLMSRVEKKS